MRCRPAPLGAWVGVKLRLVRFRSCAWLCRANASGPVSAVGATLAVARKPSPSKGEGGTTEGRDG